MKPLTYPILIIRTLMAGIQKQYRYVEDFDLFDHYSKNFMSSSGGTMKINEKFGHGSIRILPVTKGISLSINDVSYNQDLFIKTSKENYSSGNQICFYSYLSGSAEFTFEKRSFKISSGSSDIFTQGFDKSIKQKIIKNSPIKVLGILFDHDTFYKITGKKPEEIFILSSRISKAGSMQMPMAMRRAALQLAFENIGEVDKKLFMEAKVLELLSYKLGQLEAFNKSENKKNEPGTKSFAEQIHYAAEILQQEMLDPPGIFDLAKEVGLSHNKLIQGFKEIYSSTPFEFLRQARLKKAKDLIMNHGFSVTEAAFNVGYSNLSNFARIFRKEFNINPSSLRQAIR